MKTLRYLLIVVILSVASMVFATAQSLAQQPKVEMKSTSGMVYSGSNLPQAAADGAVLTGSKLGTYSPAGMSGPNRAKRAGENEGTEDEEDPDNPAEPFPLGDAALPLALLACAYVLARAFLKRRTRA